MVIIGDITCRVRIMVRDLIKLNLFSTPSIILKINYCTFTLFKGPQDTLMYTGYSLIILSQNLILCIYFRIIKRTIV